MLRFGHGRGFPHRRLFHGLRYVHGGGLVMWLLVAVLVVVVLVTVLRRR